MRVSTSTIYIQAPPDVVWAVLTETDQVRQWQYGSELSTDWAVGSPIRFTNEWDGQRFEQWGTVLVVEALTIGSCSPRARTTRHGAPASSFPCPVHRLRRSPGPG
ncbi:SRPBCC domain-containing protein [Nocardioides sp.]|uniref:SRPBCC domain-containing protein n=1 Tax=Nocardioides sp. TaxID=35761 RepID=UPI00344BAFD7